jgi:molybdopterin synthase catalytic subunit
MRIPASDTPICVSIQAAPFDEAAEKAVLIAGRMDVGAVVAFTGYCRSEGGRLEALELEHYPGMAEEEITRICQEAAGRWPLLGLRVVHRFGKIAPGEGIVLVLAASAHRAAAFAGADFVMDFLKSRAPFWKKEHGVDGARGDWVAAKDEDEASLARWGASPE